MDPVLAILTALPKEHSAVGLLLRNRVTHKEPGDTHLYELGDMDALGGRHPVVLGVLSKYGTNMAGIAATHLLRTFGSIRDIIFVGIAGGIPRPQDASKHVRLGDIVVSADKGVVQFDMGVRTQGGHFQTRDNAPPPSAALLQAVRLLESKRLSREFDWSDFLQTRLSEAGVRRPSREPRNFRHPRDPNRLARVPHIHSGKIGASNIKLKDAEERDRLAREFDLLAVEMEGSGVADATWVQGVGYLVIRGICDYADSTTDDSWQTYAAHASAAYLAALLHHLPPSTRSTASSPSPVRAAPHSSTSVRRYPVLDELEATQQYAAACKWIQDEWHRVKSWDLLLRFLRLMDLLGHAASGLAQHMELRSALDADPPRGVEWAERYYIARLRGQNGWITDSLNLHAQNVEFAPLDDKYRLKSRFEIAQLRFRVESFNESRQAFGLLRNELAAVAPTLEVERLKADAAKFLGTFEMLHLIHDPPYSDLRDWPAGSAEACVSLANAAREFASAARYDDAIGWSYVVEAFGNEGMERWSETKRAYQDAKAHFRIGPGHRTSLIYAMLYEAGFERRREEFNRAYALLDAAERSIDTEHGPAMRAQILEQLAFLAYHTGRQAEARDQIGAAMRLYLTHDPAFQARLEWPKVLRLRRTCEEWGADVAATPGS